MKCRMRCLNSLLAVLLFAGPAFAQEAPPAPVEKQEFPLLSLIRVPNVRQSSDYTACVAALQSMLAYYGLDTREDELARELKAVPAGGAVTAEVQKAALARGLKAERRVGVSLDELKKTLDERKPALLLIQAWSDKKPADYAKDWEDGHCVVAVGYDKLNLYLMDPSVIGRYAYIPLEEFLPRWHDMDGEEKAEHLMLPVYGLAPRYQPEEPVRTE